MGRTKKPARAVPAPVVSDSLGCIDSQVEEFRAEAKHLGFTGIDFRPDPHEPTTFQCHASSRAELLRYAKKTMDYVDLGERNGSAAQLSPETLADAERLIRRKYGTRPKC